MKSPFPTIGVEKLLSDAQPDAAPDEKSHQDGELERGLRRGPAMERGDSSGRAGKAPLSTLPRLPTCTKMWRHMRSWIREVMEL